MAFWNPRSWHVRNRTKVDNLKTGAKITGAVFGCLPVGIAVLIAIGALLFFSVLSVVGRASQDPQFAIETGLDTVFNNTPQGETPTQPPISTTSPSTGPTPDNTFPPNSCSQVLGVCKSSCGEQEIENSTGKCTTGICCTREKPSSIHYVFYCQWRPNWGCNIANKGCVPTSIAMAMSSFGDTQWNPRTVAYANNQRGCWAGTGFPYFEDWIRRQGYLVSDNLARGSFFNVASAREFLARGYIIVAGANINSHSYNGGHAFVITAIDAFGNARVLDPNYCRGSERGQRVFNVSRIGYPLLGSRPWGGAHAIKKI